MDIKKGKYVIDTNVLISNIEVLEEYENIIIPIQVLEELDGFKCSELLLGFQARTAIKKLNLSDNIIYECIDLYENMPKMWQQDKRDNKIIMSALNNNAILISNDINVIVKAKSLNVEIITPSNTSNSYTGYREFSGNTEFISKFHEEIDKYDFLQNEYVILKDTSLNKTYEFKWNNKLEILNFPKFQKGKEIKGLNPLQRCCLDLMNNEDIPIKIIMGGYGSGKTFLSVQIALMQLKKNGKYGSILCVREPVGEGKEIGFLKGSKEEKTESFFKPIEHSLEGGSFELQDMIQKGQLECDVPYFMKGCTYNNTIIICDEAEDIKYKQLKLIGTRLGKESCIYLIGDYKQSIYDISYNNGLLKLANQLKGNPKVGIITLGEDVRSEASKIFADLD